MHRYTVKTHRVGTEDPGSMFTAHFMLVSVCFCDRNYFKITSAAARFWKWYDQSGSSTTKAWIWKCRSIDPHLVLIWLSIIRSSLLPSLHLLHDEVPPTSASVRGAPLTCSRDSAPPNCADSWAEAGEPFFKKTIARTLVFRSFEFVFLGVVHTEDTAKGFSHAKHLLFYWGEAPAHIA